MKTLSVQQPWASLIVKGIKDIENRIWKTPYRGKILIHASSAKVSKDWVYEQPLEYFTAIFNEQRFGNMPFDLKELPTSAIIGYVEIESIIESGQLLDSAWDAGSGCYRWKLVNAYEFDEPITGVKGKLNLYDYPEISEDNLPPAHIVDLNTPVLDGETWYLPVAPEIYDDIMEGNGPTHTVQSDIYASYYRDLFDEKGNLKKITRLVIEDGESIIGFEVKGMEVLSLANENGEDFRWWAVHSVQRDHCENAYLLNIELGESYKVELSVEEMERIYPALGLGSVLDEALEGEDDAWGTPEGAFQLSVEDMFQITGIGVSLSGIVDSGTVHSGDAVIIAGDDAQIDGVVKHVEQNRQIGDSAQAGDEIGLVVKGLTRKDIKALGANLFVVRADEVE